MFKLPTWIRGARQGVPVYGVLNRLRLPNMQSWFSYTASTSDSLSAEIVQNPEISQHTGSIQGGVITLGCETLACMAASLCVPDSRIVVATSINTHYSAACEGTVTLTTQCIHSGSRSATWHVKVSDQSGKTCATSTVAMAVLRQR